jgi:cell division protein FtsB
MPAKNRRLGRLVWIAIGLGVGWFAVQGGEYATTDLLTQRRRQERLQARLDSLQHELDSLQRLKHAILTDPAVQERIAREEFGMVRGGREMLYRFTADSVAPPR